MKRVLAIALLIAASGVLAVVAAGAGSSPGERYLVRAIFDNAGFVQEGMDVKIAGVTVGKVDSLHVTPEDKAAIVLDITEPAYHDFRTDANCIVRPQSLIGERFVECTPTRKRAVGTAPPPELRRIESGAGEGQRLLPVENTSRAVDLDEINNVMRLPYRQRFSILLNELGATVAGRGEDLREVIRRADPAFKEIDEVLEILADQNRTLTRLAENSDEALAPLARERRRVTGFIERSSEVAAATAERREDLEADIERLPRFLAELTPTMQRLGELSTQAEPVLADLGAEAPAINQVIRELGPFSQAGIPALDTLGEAAEVGAPALEEARPIVRDLRGFARRARPVGETLADVLVSVRKTGGIERLMDLIYFQTAAINGYDELGHYLRARLLANNCVNYSVAPISGCVSNFRAGGSGGEASAAGAEGGDLEAIGRAAKALGQGAEGVEDVAPAAAGLGGAAEPKPEATPDAAASRGPATGTTPRAGAKAGAEAGMLDYLLGSEGE